MFIGHFAVAFAAKRAAPAVSLGTLFLACQLADLLWPTFVLLGLEWFAITPGITAVTPLDFQSYPYSHSLVAAGGWAALAALVYRAVRRPAGLAAAAVIFVVVLSHWILDAIAHRPDLPLTIGGATKVGLELWASKPATIVVEVLMFAIGIALYVRTSRPIDRVGTWALWSLVAFFLVLHAVNLFGPPPPSVTVVGWSAQALWLFVAWGYWVDRHRSA